MSWSHKSATWSRMRRSVDRGREAKVSDQETAKLDVEDALSEAGEYIKAIPNWTLRVDRWFGQPKHVSVWVEKDALS